MSAWLERQRKIDKARKDLEMTNQDDGLLGYLQERGLLRGLLTPSKNPVGQWAQGVAQRTFHPLETLAGLAQESMADPVNTALNWSSPIAGGLVGMFAGKGAKTADVAKLALAEKLKAQGIPDEQIWKETGWTFGFPDKKPRFEIPDNAAMYRGTHPASSAYADRAVHHPELMSGYPDIGAIRFEELDTPIGGQYINQGSDEVIQLGGQGTQTGSTALHELQHAIQQREGFAKGGSPAAMKSEIVAADPKIVNAASQIRDMAQKYGISVDSILEKPPKYLADAANQDAVRYLAKNDDAFQSATMRALPPEEKYRRLAGEAEARLTQARMNLTPEQRLAQYPVSQFDVPVSEQLVRY